MIDVQGEPSKRTIAPFKKPVPMSVMSVPPEKGPLLGEMEIKVGELFTPG